MCNCEEKKYNINFGCCVPIVANADAYYTKEQVDEKIDDIVISGGGITSGEVQTMIDSSIADKADKSEIPTVPNNVSAFVNDVPYLTEHQSLTDYATKQWVEDKHYITGVDLSDYALKEEIPDISGYATEQWVNDQGFLKTHQSLEGYATENWVQSQGYLTQHQDLSDYALKSEIPDISGYATEQWVNDQGFLKTHQSLEGYATETWVQSQGYLTQHQDLSDYALKSEIPDISGLASETYVSNYTYDKATIDQKIGEGGIFDPTQYYTTAQTYSKTEVNNLLDDKLDASAYTPCDLSNYYTKDETNNQISSATADMATKTWVQNQGYLTQHQNLDNYYTKSETSGKTEIQNALNSKADKTEIPSLDGYATENWVQSQGYLTQHQDLSNYALKSEIPDISGKQDISGMTAYTQITSFTAHTADTNVHVTQTEKNTWNNKVSQTTLNNYLLKSKIWCGTQSEYDSITNKDSETLYLIHS